MPAAALPVLVRLLPGLALCVAVALAASAVAAVEARLFGQAWLEPLVLAILLGAAVRSLWPPPERCRPGIDLAAHRVLEAAVVLMGAAVGSAALAGLGPSLLAAIAVLVAVSIAGGYGLCRLFGLAPRLALLVACGNSICGNSAIAAVAPVIRAEGREVASAVAFTAVLGVAVVLLLPLAAPAFGLTPQQYGVLAGLTVYAVPQVLAAAAPLGVASIQVATVVKLVRVLMLGPVVLAFALADRRRAAGSNAAGAEAPAAGRSCGAAGLRRGGGVGLRSGSGTAGFTVTGVAGSTGSRSRFARSAQAVSSRAAARRVNGARICLSSRVGRPGSCSGFR
ncbi:YeiH family protein [Caenispirillum bisanense]|uniref:YeiH family protein n=1 Tax=Caenispirillum bisanense TaxID=414052 RepID=UPI0031E3E736